MAFKKCNSCQKILDIESFRECKYPNGKIYFKSYCKKYESIQQVARVKENGRNWTEEQKKAFSEYKKQWKKINKERENLKYRDRIKKDVIFRLRKNVSIAINHGIKRCNSNKNSSIMMYLPYSMKKLKQHLEKQFTLDMSWDNYGLYWHIDHIMPHSCFPYKTMKDDNFLKCWKLSNLRPLEAKQNMLDGSTRIRHKKFQLIDGDK